MHFPNDKKEISINKHPRLDDWPWQRVMGEAAPPPPPPSCSCSLIVYYFLSGTLSCWLGFYGPVVHFNDGFSVATPAHLITSGGEQAALSTDYTFSPVQCTECLQIYYFHTINSPLSAIKRMLLNNLSNEKILCVLTTVIQKRTKKSIYDLNLATQEGTTKKTGDC